MTSQEGGNALGVKSHGVDRAVPLGPGIARLHRATLALVATLGRRTAQALRRHVLR